MSDTHTYLQRKRERERMHAESCEHERLQAQQQVDDEIRQHEHEVEVGRERGWKAGWGDRETWLWIAFFICVVASTWLAAYFLIGQSTLQHWHLGFPPTAPE